MLFERVNVKNRRLQERNLEKDHKEGPGGGIGKREGPCQQKARKHKAWMEGEVGGQHPMVQP